MTTDLAEPLTADATPSGYRYVVLVPGQDGAKAGPTALVSFYYTARTLAGDVLDACSEGRPAMYALSSAIEGWREAIAEMTTGEKIRVWIPERGRQGGGWRSPGTLVFDIELVEIVDRMQ